MGDGYEAAKAGGKHHGLLERHRELPDHLLEKAARSFLRRIAEHERWIARPEEKLAAGTDAAELSNLVQKKWPKDLGRLKAQLDIVQEILRERKR